MKKQHLNPSIYRIGLNVSVQRLAPTRCVILLSVSTEIGLGDLITILHFLDGQAADTAFHVIQNGDNLAVQAVTQYETPGDLDKLLSALSKLVLHNTLQVM